MVTKREDLLKLRNLIQDAYAPIQGGFICICSCGGCSAEWSAAERNLEKARRLIRRLLK